MSFGVRQMMRQVFWVGNKHQRKQSGLRRFFFKLKSDCWRTGTVSTCSAQCSFSPESSPWQQPAPGSQRWCQEFCNGCLSSGKTDGSLIYIYLYLPSNKHFNLDTITHILVCFKNSFNDIYVLFDLWWHWFCLSNMVKIKASFLLQCRKHNLPWQGEHCTHLM